MTPEPWRIEGSDERISEWLRPRVISTYRRLAVTNADAPLGQLVKRGLSFGIAAILFVLFVVVNDGVAIGSYPFFKQGRVGANFVVRSEEESLARKVAGELEGALAAAGYDAVEGGI